MPSEDRDDTTRAASAPPVPPVPPLAPVEQRVLAGAVVLIVLVLVIAVVAGSSTDDGASGSTAATTTTRPAAAPLASTEPRRPPRPATPPPGVVADPDDPTVLVDRERRLPAGYGPTDLVDAPVPFTFEHPDPKRQVRQRLADPLADLFAAAEAAGMPLRAVSAFRSEQAQSELHSAYVAQDGQAAADRYSARPGHSEHQTGLAIDVTSFDGACPAEDCFGDRPEAAWVAEHAHEHGFVVRYPEGAEAITGYTYEPWHLRFVGVELATELHRLDLTLDEWYGVTVD